MRALLERSSILKTRSRKLLVLQPKIDKRLCRLAEDFKVPLEKLLRLKERSTKLPASQPKIDKLLERLEAQSRLLWMRSKIPKELFNRLLSA